MVREYTQLLDWVIVKIDDVIYADTPENFEKDFGEKLLVLPPGLTKHYIEGQCHALKRGCDVVDGGERNCKITNEVFKNLTAAIENKTNREKEEEKIRTDKFLADFKAVKKVEAEKTRKIMEDLTKKAEEEAKKGTEEQFLIAIPKEKARLAKLEAAKIDKIVTLVLDELLKDKA